MKMRHKIVSPWTLSKSEGSFSIQVADIIDQRNGRTYVEGAHRVVDANLKPAKIGKGGTVPFIGESAWSDAERLLRDLALAERWAS